ncbi:MAG: hypothetical protein DCF17_10855 [Shackletoniella antarctica]|uniref:Uncharacterized protein n=1 Tax=Shackletoniella antarctica TaxID=268115 RepID=A0A2W4W923_9CYAN|nr:MAG: hypothetical protein DCF17_10855 [Shackletoniella antarctica]
MRSSCENRPSNTRDRPYSRNSYRYLWVGSRVGRFSSYGRRDTVKNARILPATERGLTAWGHNGASWGGFCWKLVGIALGIGSRPLIAGLSRNADIWLRWVWPKEIINGPANAAANRATDRTARQAPANGPGYRTGPCPGHITHARNGRPSGPTNSGPSGGSSSLASYCPCYPPHSSAKALKKASALAIG